MGKDAFYKRGELLRGSLNKKLKKRMVKTLVWSVVLYGSETWTMRKDDIKINDWRPSRCGYGAGWRELAG